MKKLLSATALPPAPEIINERPEGMDFKEYKERLKEMNQKLRKRRKGFLVFLANEVLFDDKGRPYGM